MKYPWLYVGAKVTPTNPNPDWWDAANEDQDFTKPQYGVVYTVANIGEWNSLIAIGLEEMPDDTGYDVRDFAPVLPDTTKQVEEMKRLMRDHVANASGGMGIRKPVRA